MKKAALSSALALLLATGALLPSTLSPAAASDIKYVVNSVPVTSYDIQRRAAFLKLQRKTGNLNKMAGEDMVEQTLKMAEVRRLKINISDDQVNEAYQRFAKNNKMTLQQLNGVMEQSGVTPAHFKEYIRAQMGWNQALGMRFRSKSGGGGRVTEQDAVRRMLKDGGNKPSATEYMLQQVIFVVPAAERASGLGRRKKEAEAMRLRFSGCESTRQFAKGLVDVTVRDLGRTLAPQLPPEWADAIKSAKQGGATPVRETERGVEFIGICSAREVSNDSVAQMVFQGEAASGKDKDGQADELNKKYVAELRERAKIVER